MATKLRTEAREKEGSFVPFADTAQSRVGTSNVFLFLCYACAFEVLVSCVCTGAELDWRDGLDR